MRVFYHLPSGASVVPGVGAAGELAAGAGQRQLAAAAAAAGVGRGGHRQAQLAQTLDHREAGLAVQLQLLAQQHTVRRLSHTSTLSILMSQPLAAVAYLIAAKSVMKDLTERWNNLGKVSLKRLGRCFLRESDKIKTNFLSRYSPGSDTFK